MGSKLAAGRVVIYPINAYDVGINIFIKVELSVVQGMSSLKKKKTKQKLKNSNFSLYIETLQSY